jgi:hypothetical protein
VLEVVMVLASGPDSSFRFYRDPPRYLLDVGYAPSPAFRIQPVS